MADTQIAGMVLPEAKRSALMQIVELRKLYEQLTTLNLDAISQEHVDQLYRDLDVRHNNFDLTVDRIEELEAS